MGAEYYPSQRRSVQTAVLYEANRCLNSRYSALRPFQRKIALYDCAVDLINSLTFIPPYHKLEIMFRTASGKVPLSPELAWRRMKLIDREISKVIVPGVKPFMRGGKSHSAACDAFIQKQYETVSKQKGAKHPDHWEYSHIHIFLAYRMFYDGESVSASLPPATDPNPARVVPNKKPQVYPPFPHMGTAPPVDSGYGSDDLKVFASQITASSSAPRRMGLGKRKKGELDDETRRAMLKEVKDHLDVLKELEKVVPPAEMEKRKKALWAAMPPTPGPFLAAGGGGKRNKAAAAASPSKKKPAAKAADDDESDLDSVMDI